MSKSWIQTFIGHKFFPLDPEPSLIDVRDIARSLSMQCRFVGHVSRFYSVAEHSVRISEKLAERGYPIWVCMWGLFHDASEAYLGDVSRPVKHQPEMEPYRARERWLQHMIVRVLNLPEVEPKAVSDIDTEILGSEAYYLKSPIHPDWHNTTRSGVALAAPWKLGWFDRFGWSPEKAERRFLQRYEDLRWWRMDDWAREQGWL